MTAHVCRVGDVVVGVCEGPGSDHPRDFTGVWCTGSDTAILDGQGVVRVGDTGTTDCGHTFQAVTGSEVGTADGQPVHRVGDLAYVLEGGVGVSVTGSESAEAN